MKCSSDCGFGWERPAICKAVVEAELPLRRSLRGTAQVLRRNRIAPVVSSCDVSQKLSLRVYERQFINGFMSDDHEEKKID